MQKVKDIRQQLKQLYNDEIFVTDKSGQKTVELLGATFIADEDHIVREPNYEYIKREIQWYKSMSRSVEDIPGKTPLIWEQVADRAGLINSNYGWLIWAPSNYFQYEHTRDELIKNPDSRRATMIYQRPSMHHDYNRNGMSDFICTYANGFFIRDNKLHSHYMMRSNDAIFGYNNDVAWANYVHDKLLFDLQIVYPDLEKGDLIWTASSLHVYERHFEHLENMEI